MKHQPNTNLTRRFGWTSAHHILLAELVLTIFPTNQRSVRPERSIIDLRCLVKAPPSLGVARSADARRGFHDRAQCAGHGRPFSQEMAVRIFPPLPAPAEGVAGASLSRWFPVTAARVETVQALARPANLVQLARLASC